MGVVAALAEERRAARRRAHEGEGEEAERVGIVGVRLRERAHGERVGAIARGAVPGSEQRLYGV